MVLIINSTPNQQDPIGFDSQSVHLEEICDRCPALLEAGKAFAQKPCHNFPPENVLYVRQKEDAITYVGDKLADGQPVHYCGTQDVLTCHVVV